jgi:hypothetical protein
MVEVLIYIKMLFIFSSPVLIKHLCRLRQLFSCIGVNMCSSIDTQHSNTNVIMFTYCYAKCFITKMNITIWRVRTRSQAIFLDSNKFPDLNLG